MVDYINKRILEHLTYIDWNIKLGDEGICKILEEYKYTVELLEYLKELTKKENYVTKMQADNIKVILNKYRELANNLNKDHKKELVSLVNEILLNVNNLEFDEIYEQTMIDEIRKRLGEEDKKYDKEYDLIYIDESLCNILLQYRTSDLATLDLITSTDARTYNTKFSAEDLILILSSLNYLIDDEPSLLEDSVVNKNIDLIINYTNKEIDNFKNYELLVLSNIFKTLVKKYNNKRPKQDEVKMYIERKKLLNYIHNNIADKDYLKSEELVEQILLLSFDNMISCILGRDELLKLQELLYENMKLNNVVYDLDKFKGLYSINLEEYNDYIINEYKVRNKSNENVNFIDVIDDVEESIKNDYNVILGIMDNNCYMDKNQINQTINSMVNDNSPLLDNKIFKNNAKKIYKLPNNKVKKLINILKK